MNIAKRKFQAVVLAGLTAILATPSQADADKVRYVEVSATGSASAAPDNAMLSLTVLRPGKTAHQALDANNAAMTKVMSGMLGAGIAEADLQTSGFAMQPQYNHPPPGTDGRRPAPELTGYTVSNRLTVRVRDMGKVGAILDKAVSLGVNQIGNIRFLTEYPAQLQEQARIAAMKNAMTKALTLTRSGDVALGSVISIAEQSTGMPLQMMRGKRAVMAAPGRVPVAGGEITHTVDVRVRWALAD